MTEEKKVKPLPSNVVVLSEKIRQSITVDSKTGVGSESERGSIYRDNIPEGLDEETIAKVNDYDISFIEAGTDAFGRLSLAALEQNNELNRTTASLGMWGKNTLSVGVDRHKTYSNPQGGDDIIKHGVVTVKYDVSADKNAGVLKRVREDISAIALDLLRK